MARIFVYDGREFPDPDPSLSVEDVKRQMGEFFPELANAESKQEQRGEDTVHTFSRRIGTKGQAPDVVGALRAVPTKELLVFRLAAELLDTNGELDLDRAAARQPEVNLAIAEATAYAEATRRAREALDGLPPS